MSNQAIGVFDSGLGGLTAVRQLQELLPGENIVYFGDTARVPYGTKGRDVILSYAQQDIAFLLTKNVKFVLAACGTVSSTYPKEAGRALPVGYMGVVEPTCRAAAQTSRTGRIGVIATEASISSGIYQSTLSALLPNAVVTAKACPLFVPLVESGHFSPTDRMAALAAEEYLAPLKEDGIDTLILGCTHYPLLAPVISAQMGPAVTLVDSGKEAALALREKLAAAHLLNPAQTGGSTHYYVSDAPDRFRRLAGIFLGEHVSEHVGHVSIETFAAPAAATDEKR